jgi:uncharacterized membrane protein YdjX (TVP38/TMEM64 family)
MTTDEKTSHPPSCRRALLLVPVIVAIALYFSLGLNRYVTCSALAEHREWLLAQVATFGVLAGIGFVLIYAALVAVSIPGATFLTIAAGFLFGVVFGAGLAVIGATAGATAIFLLARTALGDIFRARAGSAIQRLEAGFRRNALNYLLFLRLVPAFPFFVVNIVPAFLGVDLRTYVLGTALGIVPGGIVWASVGNGLGAVFAHGDKCDLHSIGRNPAIWLPFVALALLSLLPIAYRSWRHRQGAMQ